jgi:carbamoylphosphate synthase large subunit
MNYSFLINRVIVPGSSYWNMAIGRNPGEVRNDTEGIQTMKTLGQNMAWLITKICRWGFSKFLDPLTSSEMFVATLS